MSGSSAVSAAQGWFKPLQGAPLQNLAAPTGATGPGSIAQAITQVLSGKPTIASSGASSISSQVQNTLLNLQAVGGQDAGGQTAGGQVGGGQVAGKAASANLGGMRHDHHHRHASDSDGSQSAGLPAAISSTANDIATVPNALQQSVTRAMQSYLASANALTTPAGATPAGATPAGATPAGAA